MGMFDAVNASLRHVFADKACTLEFPKKNLSEEIADAEIRLGGFKGKYSATRRRGDRGEACEHDGQAVIHESGLSAEILALTDAELLEGVLAYGGEAYYFSSVERENGVIRFDLLNEELRRRTRPEYSR